ncbi:DNA repair protein RecO [Maridesulfovibrio salexigens]|uniref:DNA repair protein RecO n=1 Tax=Maridesulfovibrio salexigens (strain ATCC 14822 / DSM 2638 / NCIMB 8403 / VKM B-1763) TaxID=526222 RepID=RECO_MARSD|nr:DNA repair protein RecO [Maridesulfovibrio salexigens]C6BV69.1 RecName: Full=DNA repair protein RecO; AltName: Full=Recombination protein O [Maridesulfovibrio salexigens DSM 2638]ACS80044.1 DNA repair protein RecO [Maridesulfovibrio salexigens DSM 2638]
MELTEKVVILKTGKFKENDLWVRFLSATRGVQNAFAFGGSRSRRRFGGCLEPFSQVLFKTGTNKTGTYQVLQEGSLVKGYPGIRSDFRKMGLAANCFKFIESAVLERDGNRAVFDLLTETLDVIEEADPDDFFPLFFRAKVAFEQGYNPDFTICAQCGKPLFSSRPVVFNIEKGQLNCLDCNDGRQGETISSGTARTLAWIQDTGPASWINLRLPADIRQECFSVMDRFMAYHMGVVWEGNGYRKI